MQWQSIPKPNAVVAMINLRREFGLLNSVNVSSSNSALEADVHEPIILNVSIGSTPGVSVMCLPGKLFNL